jgi:hypothetical protein
MLRSTHAPALIWTVWLSGYAGVYVRMCACAAGAAGVGVEVGVGVRVV